MYKFIGTIFCVLVFIACEETPFYDQIISIPNSEWSYDFKPEFKVAATDTSQMYDLFLNIDHNTSYSFENLYLKITTSFPKSNSKEETLSIDLAEKIGQWVGDCNSQKCTTKVYLLESFKFGDPGEYVFTIEQFSRQDKLKDINSLELQIFEQSKSKR